MAEGTAVIDGVLPALSAIMSNKRCAEVLAVRQHSMPIFASTEPAPAGSSLDSGNRCVAEDKFCRLIGHTSASLQKAALDVD